MAMNKYTYCVLKLLPNNSKFKYHINWRIRERVNEIREIKQPIVCACLKYHKWKQSSEFIYFSDLPGRSGLGSSSAFCNSVNILLMNKLNKVYDKFIIANKSYHIEKNILNDEVGIQDQIASSFGGLNYVSIDKKGNFKVKPIILKIDKQKRFLNRLLIVYTENKEIPQRWQKKY